MFRVPRGCDEPAERRDRRTKRRDHAQDALACDFIERLYDEDVLTVSVGALTDVLETHWSVETNAKTNNFWVFRAFVNRLVCPVEEYNISVRLGTDSSSKKVRRGDPVSAHRAAR